MDIECSPLCMDTPSCGGECGHLCAHTVLIINSLPHQMRLVHMHSRVLASTCIYSHRFSHCNYFKA